MLSATYNDAAMAAIIRWDPPTKPNGIIVGYELQITTIPPATHVYQTWLQPSSRKLQYPVPALCTNYVVLVAPATAAARANFSTRPFTANSPGMTRTNR